MIRSDDYLTSARQALAAAHESLSSDIRIYPTPIAGCDEQFNKLLSQRKNALAAMRMLDRENFVPTPRRLTP